jgi:hypothetical protein
MRPNLRRWEALRSRDQPVIPPESTMRPLLRLRRPHRAPAQRLTRRRITTRRHRRRLRLTQSGNSRLVVEVCVPLLSGRRSAVSSMPITHWNVRRNQDCLDVNSFRTAEPKRLSSDTRSRIVPSVTLTQEFQEGRARRSHHTDARQQPSEALPMAAVLSNGSDLSWRGNDLSIRPSSSRWPADRRSRGGREPAAARSLP